MKRFACSLFLIAAIVPTLTACGEDPPVEDPPDANQNADVVEVDCSTTTAAEIITTAGLAYDPTMVTINVGETVRFDPTAGHDVNGAEFDVPIAGEGCFRFNAAGTYSFSCTPHGFQGSVVVEE